MTFNFLVATLGHGFILRSIQDICCEQMSNRLLKHEVKVICRSATAPVHKLVSVSDDKHNRGSRDMNFCPGCSRAIEFKYELEPEEEA